jgi:hypothetical protein
MTGASSGMKVCMVGEGMRKLEIFIHILHASLKLCDTVACK